MAEPTLAHLDLDEVPFDAERRPLPRRILLVEAPLAVAFLAGALTLALMAPAGRELDLVAAAVAVVVFAGASLVRMDIGTGFAVPTGLALVPLCALVPAKLIPLALLVALLCAGVFEAVTEGRHPARLMRNVVDAIPPSLPALILVAAGDPELADLPAEALLAFLLAGPVAEFTVFHLRMRATGEFGGIPLSATVRDLGWVQVVDVALAPIGLVIALGTADRPLLLLSLLGLVGILAVFARERRARLRQLTQLNHTYRGSAQVLGEVVRATDTSAHAPGCDAVELALAVAAELGLTRRERYLVEFGALLRDVGMVSVPRHIVAKPAALDDEEWRIVRDHTIAGQRMLDRVGGEMAAVGVVVRATHERWDGGGYPDGLAGEAIPLAARIVACCDAFAAMSSDRPHRPARSRAEAVAELKRHHGTQFDPQATEALLRVISVRPIVPLGAPQPLAA